MAGPRRELSEEEKKAIRAVFDSFNTDGEVGQTGATLSLDEMKKAMLKVAPHIPDKDIQLIIDDIDENGDGQVDFNEFYSIMRKKLLGLEAEDDVLQAFALLDKDKNGFISPPELRHLLTSVGRNPLSQEEADELLHMADSDGDGLISYQEFFKWLSREAKE
uniref:Calmodulin n=1 Tax=Chromera velia CCMP2878 TaxID=1169474 RepID=A0A0G4FJU6_9ALVE|eukprot:Cvel_17415.t1-p1 / transcript=Cvel_17415.t1 / gene=Cvel_17415 / organism=Chromera_velia_CCMP2878 / gene_product=Putative calmodulin-like protein 2, putative / transcript_product=Putative calmodulin-like protein 2, putative / location=Cvel_scaffold1387:29796-32331(+) / protein_length=161 / sequence_SO=supercontig / SO=protein_coding / is_pseudo=false